MVEKHQGVTAIEIVKICIQVNTEKSQIIYNGVVTYERIMVTDA